MSERDHFLENILDRVDELTRRLAALEWNAAYIDTVVGHIVGETVLWFGSVDSGGHPIVDGQADSRWHIADGSTVNGVVLPDLRDKFVVGAGHEYNKGNTGGTETNYLSHRHSFSVTSTGPSDTVEVASGSGATVATDSHTHTVSGDTDYQLGSYVENRPPYYALYYIVYVG